GLRARRADRRRAGAERLRRRSWRAVAARLSCPRADSGGLPVVKLVVHVDGGARGNPGPAAIGVVISEPGGAVVDEFAERIGVATNNVAEYTALLRGVQRA